MIEIEQLRVFTADISFVIIVLTLSLLWKEQQAALITGAMIYLSFTLLWHFPPGIMNY